MRNLRVLLGLLAVLALTLTFTAPVAAYPPGNNGTVKIEDSVNPKPEPANDPHVCEFAIKFDFADEVQTGDWWILSWPPTGDKSKVLDGSYQTDVNGYDRAPGDGYFSLPDGHYKLFWEGRLKKNGDRNIKHKTFWVDCAEPTPEPTETPTPAPSETPTPAPSETPTPAPSETPSPSETPTPTETPAATPTPSDAPTPAPSDKPTPPQTDTIGGSGTTGNGLFLVLAVVALASFGATFLVRTKPR